VKLPVTGQPTHATVLVTRSLLFYGEGRGAEPYLHVLDKKTGRELAKVELPATTNTAPMTYMHKGRQYIVLSVAGPGHPAEMVALTLPAKDEKDAKEHTGQ
jgi:quinoprotein glucose dehydrogenase